MSCNDSKRRKVEVDDQSTAASNAKREGGITSSLTPELVSEVMAMMDQLKNKMNEMESISSRMDDLEGLNKSSRDEIRELKSKISRLEERLSDMDNLEWKCKMLEHRCLYLERTVQLSVKEDDNRNTYAHKKWLDSAPHIKERHWLDQGFDEDYVAMVTNFIIDLKHKSYGFRRGVHYADIILGEVEGAEDEAEVLLHDDSLLANWMEFADSLQLCHYSHGEESFSLTNIQLTPEVLRILSPAMSSKKFTSFRLNRNEFTDTRHGIDFVIDAIRHSSELKSLIWENNSMEQTNLEDARDLLEAIYDKPCIKNITFKNICDDGFRGYFMLRLILANMEDIERLDMSSNNMADCCLGAALSNYLSGNPPLTYLNLENNRLDDNDASRIAHGLKQNTNLKELQLGGNDIGLGCLPLQKSICDLTSFKTVANSNHACHIGGLSFDEMCNNRSNYSENCNQRTKVRDFLFSRSIDGTLVHHLNEELGEHSLKLAPRVLRYVGKRVHYYGDPRRDRFSCMYGIIRGWLMPDLFENQRTVSKKIP